MQIMLYDQPPKFGSIIEGLKELEHAINSFL
jgi:hypothetical protein